MSRDRNKFIAGPNRGIQLLAAGLLALKKLFAIPFQLLLFADIASNLGSPMTTPWSSTIADMVKETSMMLPSFLRRTVSNVSTLSLDESLTGRNLLRLAGQVE